MIKSGVFVFVSNVALDCHFFRHLLNLQHSIRDGHFVIRVLWMQRNFADTSFVLRGIFEEHESLCAQVVCARVRLFSFEVILKHIDLAILFDTQLSSHTELLHSRLEVSLLVLLLPSLHSLVYLSSIHFFGSSSSMCFMPL